MISRGTRAIRQGDPSYPPGVPRYDIITIITYCHLHPRDWHMPWPNPAISTRRVSKGTAGSRARRHPRLMQSVGAIRPLQIGAMAMRTWPDPGRNRGDAWSHNAVHWVLANTCTDVWPFYVCTDGSGISYVNSCTAVSIPKLDHRTDPK
jgi:hypothetical protein